MSKKILKRSLALGALMAFVITGSAMAGNVTLTIKENATEFLEDMSGVFTITGQKGSTLNVTGALYISGTVEGLENLNIESTWAGVQIYGDSHIQANNISITSGSSAIYVPYDANEGTILDIDFGNKMNVFSGNAISNHGINTVIDIEGGEGSKFNAVLKSGNGIWVYSGSKDTKTSLAADTVYIETTKHTTITAEGENADVDIVAKDLTLIRNLDDKNVLSAAGKGSDINIIASGISTIKGNIVSGNVESTVSVNITGEESNFTGKVNTVEGATTNLTLNGATWNVTGNSVITNVEGNGTIKLDMVSEDAVATVDATSISETTTVGATSTVTDYLAGLSGEEQTEAMKKVVESVQVDGEAVTDTITTDEGMVTGAYTLRVNEDGSVEAAQAVNTKSDAVSDAGMALKGHWRAHMNDMNKRMGDLRMANGETGVWTRMVRGESEYQGAKMQYNQYQLGYDEKLSVDKRWTVGAAVTFSEGDASYGYGSTDDKSTAFAIYGSKLNNDGTFVDLIARYAHLESDLEDRVYGNGDYSTNGMSVSAEFGKRIEQGNGLWIEPQVELTYGTVDSADVTFSNGYKAHYDSMDSFIARAGFALGKDIKQGNVYARASYLYDFDGETTTTFANGGQPIEEDFGGGWWEVGVGANINLSKATYIYADVEKTFGGEVDTNWQWNLGVRYSF